MKRTSFFDSPPQTWSAQGDSIHTSVLCDGTYGAAWIPRLQARGVEMRESAKILLQTDDESDAERSPEGEFDVRILRVSTLRGNERSLLEGVHVAALAGSLQTPCKDIAGFLCEKFTVEQIRYEMCLSRIIVMHDSKNQRLLQLEAQGGRLRLSTCDASLQDCQPTCWRDIGIALIR